MERLTGFEFMAATDQPQLVRLKRRDEVVAQFGIVAWFGCADGPVLEFEDRADLVIEGNGLGKPYWNGEQPPWAVVFDPVAETNRLLTIQAVVRREMNRLILSH